MERLLDCQCRRRTSSSLAAEMEYAMRHQKPAGRIAAKHRQVSRLFAEMEDVKLEKPDRTANKIAKPPQESKHQDVEMEYATKTQQHAQVIVAKHRQVVEEL